MLPGTFTVNAAETLLAIPNVFTPNGDGINDVWNIKAIEAFPQCTVSVFERNGSLVFQSKGYGQPWDGTYRGSPMPPGTYYYVITPANGMRPFSGSVTIVR
jgi:gliding motility-associated-like protein